MDNYKLSNLELLKKIVLTDEFNDEYQNKYLYNGNISGYNMLNMKEFFNRNFKIGSILDIGCGSGDIFSLLPQINYAIEPNINRSNRAILKNSKIIIKQGWLENIPFEDNYFDTIFSWGTVTFARSLYEAFMEINRVLKIQGRAIFDVVLNTSMPINQTVDKFSFLNWINLFGFELIEKRDYCEPVNNKKLALCLEKTREFDIRRFIIPQCEGKINNYLQERDWYL